MSDKTTSQNPVPSPSPAAVPQKAVAPQIPPTPEPPPLALAPLQLITANRGHDPRTVLLERDRSNPPPRRPRRE